MPEYHNEQISRVNQMANGGDTWDLSDNDMAALRTVLDERKELYEALKEIVCWPAQGGGADTPAGRGAQCETLREALAKAQSSLAKAEGR